MDQTNHPVSLTEDPITPPATEDLQVSQPVLRSEFEEAMQAFRLSLQMLEGVIQASKRESEDNTIARIHAMEERLGQQIQINQVQQQDMFSDFGRQLKKFQEQIERPQGVSVRSEEQDSPLLFPSDTAFRRMPINQGGIHTSAKEVSFLSTDVISAREENKDDVQPIRNVRRDSALWRIEHDEVELETVDQRRFTMLSDRHLYIKWKTMTVDGFLSFLDEIDLFQKS